MGKICIIGKYPPIQGGVSKAVYLTAHGLAKSGNEVHVVSNAEEVESSYQLMLSKKDQKKMSVSYEGGSVIYHGITDVNAPEFTHIPFTPATESRLFGKGLEVLSNYGIDLIIGWYLQPYGVVAAQLSQATRIPLALIHAGSDIGRLVNHPQLEHAYKFAFGQADYILSTLDSEPGRTLQKLGVPKEKIVENIPGNYLSHYFSEKHPPIAIRDYRKTAKNWIKSLDISSDVKRQLIRQNKKSYHENRPTLAIYGKVGVVKGSFDLVHALGQIAEEGYSFNFVTIPPGKTPTLSQYFKLINRYKKLAAQTFVFPPIPFWHIPSFISACDAVFFLERNFDIEFHTPQIPMEVMAGGSCLFCSKEIIDKQFYKSILIDKNNYIEIEDPRNIPDFKQKVKKFLDKPHKMKSVGKRARRTYLAIENALDKKYPFTKAVENILAQIRNNENTRKDSPVQK